MVAAVCGNRYAALIMDGGGGVQSIPQIELELWRFRERPDWRKRSHSASSGFFQSPKGVNSTASVMVEMDSILITCYQWSCIAQVFLFVVEMDSSITN